MKEKKTLVMLHIPQVASDDGGPEAEIGAEYHISAKIARMSDGEAVVDMDIHVSRDAEGWVKTEGELRGDGTLRTPIYLIGMWGWDHVMANIVIQSQKMISKMGMYVIMARRPADNLYACRDRLGLSTEPDMLYTSIESIDISADDPEDVERIREVTLGWARRFVIGEAAAKNVFRKYMNRYKD